MKASFLFALVALAFAAPALAGNSLVHTTITNHSSVDVISARVSREQIKAKNGQVAFDGYRLRLEYVGYGPGIPCGPETRGLQLETSPFVLSMNYVNGGDRELKLARVQRTTIDLDTYARDTTPRACPAIAPAPVRMTQDLLIEKNWGRTFFRFQKAKVKIVDNIVWVESREPAELEIR